MPLSQEAKDQQHAAFVSAQERAIETAIAKAEIAVEKILNRLAHDTKKRIKAVSVDTENHSSAAVEIYLAE